MWLKNILSVHAIVGAILGVFVFSFGYQNYESFHSSSYAWGYAGFALIGGCVAGYGKYLIQHIKLSSPLFPVGLAVVFSFFCLILLVTGQSWYLQNRDYSMQNQLRQIEAHLKKLNADYLLRDNREEVLAVLAKQQQLLSSIKAKHIFAVTTQQIERVEGQLVAFTRDVAAENEVQPVPAKDVENWHQKVFVRSAKPFYIGANTIPQSPAILKNPPGSRPHKNDLIAVFFDGHIRND